MIKHTLKILQQNGQHIKCQCCPHVETSQLICCGNQMTAFYMWATLVFNGLTDQTKLHTEQTFLFKVNKKH